MMERPCGDSGALGEAVVFLDYFKDLEDILSAFEEYGALLPHGGSIVYCADDRGAAAAASRIVSRREDVKVTPYGRTALGAFRIVDEVMTDGASGFALAGWQRRFTLRIPGGHTVLNAAGALALCSLLWTKEYPLATGMDLEAASAALAEFSGSRRRSEIVGSASGILFMDDYGHHPTAINATLEGLVRFYPKRRIVVDFMSHTYSRTRALLREFGTCFSVANLVILHKIYASAREPNEGGITGRDLFNEVSHHHANVRYFDDPREAIPFLLSELRSGDLFITMGAGDNWKLGHELLHSFGGRP